ncbi:hypothetical protein J23TS9_03420 [Paenibacillus sp. J23TS9]|uniref:DUF1541 domain-containing protein n=1 Tax=Paenibacillus sp. J23TS9 TaxID=2807193 RepID=UPI001B08A11C|nr:YdhK family protein [Paenibacillus sp. J23TS9]GIP25212.1 hypothetical protein J23TS9_03420 [Paenibacillus sp. J23TS9]
MKKQLVMLGAAAMIALGGCGDQADKNNTAQEDSATMSNSDMNHSDMNHSGSGEVPQGLKNASNPAFKVGSQAVIQADHMPGMKGATATIAGAYDTTAYAVTYTPTTGGDPVKNHKWVIHEELKDAGEQPYEVGAKVVLEADHMKGMKGADATIESAKHTTVYMVDYTPSTGGEPVKNHKWVTEDELTAK